MQLLFANSLDITLISIFFKGSLGAKFYCPWTQGAKGLSNLFEEFTKVFQTKDIKLLGGEIRVPQPINFPKIDFKPISFTNRKELQAQIPSLEAKMITYHHQSYIQYDRPKLHASLDTPPEENKSDMQLRDIASNSPIQKVQDEYGLSDEAFSRAEKLLKFLGSLTVPEPTIYEYEPKGITFAWNEQGIYVIIEETGMCSVSVVHKNIRDSYIKSWDKNSEADSMKFIETLFK